MTARGQRGEREKNKQLAALRHADDGKGRWQLETNAMDHRGGVDSGGVGGVDPHPLPHFPNGRPLDDVTAIVIILPPLSSPPCNPYLSSALLSSYSLSSLLRSLNRNSPSYSLPPPPLPLPSCRRPQLCLSIAA
jgi:hypothetical protein